MGADVLVWPAERFYWAVLHPRLARGRRPTGTQLRFLFEPLVPEAMEGVHAVFHPLPDGRFLAVGVPLEALVEARAHGANSLAPRSVPDELECSIDARRVELLEGLAAPDAVRRHRMVRRTIALAGALAVITIAAAGVERRASRDRAAVDALSVAARTAIEEVIGGQRTAVLPPELLLAAELRTLERTRLAGGREVLPESVGASLSGAMARWPAGLAVRVESLHASGEHVTVRGRADDPADVDALVRAIVTDGEWRAEQPSVRDARGETTFTVRFTRGGRS